MGALAYTIPLMQFPTSYTSERTVQPASKPPAKAISGAARWPQRLSRSQTTKRRPSSAKSRLPMRRVPVDDAEGVQADQGVDEMEKPRLVDGEVGTAGQDGPGPCQPLKDQHPVARSAEQTDQMP